MNLRNNDVKTKGYVLRRTDYGEADRILNIITPEGGIVAIAKGARKPRSKLAGGIELFTLSEINVHFGKTEMGVLTGARMLKFYDKVIDDWAKMELASRIVKKIEQITRSSDNPELFGILEQSLTAINDGLRLDLVKAWCFLNLKRAIGEEVNLYRDSQGDKLVADASYVWDEQEEALRIYQDGPYGVNEIKLMRLMCTMELAAMQRIKANNDVIDKVIGLTERLNNRVV